MKKKILVVDDEVPIRDRWIRELLEIGNLANEFDVQPLSAEEFYSCLKLLEERRATSRDGMAEFEGNPDCFIDTADILIVDYDLLDFDKESGNFAGVSTGERVAYLARCYSRCGLIIALNQFGTNRFDLTLKGNPESFADLNIGSDQLTNHALWTDEGTPSFHPWYWSKLPVLAALFSERWTFLASKDEIHKPILETLGFSKETVGILPRSVIEFLCQDGDPFTLTFRDFVLKNRNSLSRQDKPLNEESIARIAAARVFKWIERLVRPGQDILVDAPHLVARFPSLLTENKTEIETWNKTTRVTQPSDLPINSELIKDFLFPELWSSKSVWYWEKLKNNESIDEIKNPFGNAGGEIPNYVFCEDISRFLPIEATREFVADLSSPFVRRYLVDATTDMGKAYFDSVRNVHYVPTVRLAL